MKNVTVVLALAALLAACGKRETVASADRPHEPISRADTDHVSLPADSPQLKQIRVEEVTASDVPTDEVVAAGKIQTNPNRVSHVAMPVSGRVVSVMVRLGDSVKQGQPLFAI